jgi:hypothetical protein
VTAKSWRTEAYVRTLFYGDLCYRCLRYTPVLCLPVFICVTLLCLTLHAAMESTNAQGGRAYESMIELRQHMCCMPACGAYMQLCKPQVVR